MKERPGKVPLEKDINIHIFSVSAAMVGVCLTVIGLIRIVITIGKSTRWRMTCWRLKRSCSCFRVRALTGPYARVAAVACTGWNELPT